jgi:hypothetical protein
MANKRDTNRRKKVAKRLTVEEMLAKKQWHSAIGFDVVESSNQRKKIAMLNNEENIKLFHSAGYVSNVRIASSSGQPGELLIRRSDRALWKVSDDGKRIEPAFSDDIITIGENDDE